MNSYKDLINDIIYFHIFLIYHQE